MKLGYAIMDAELRFVFLGGNLGVIETGLAEAIIGTQPWDAFPEEEKAWIRGESERILEPPHLPVTTAFAWGLPGQEKQFFISQKVWTGIPGAEIMSQYWEFPGELMSLTIAEREIMQLLGECGVHEVAKRTFRSVNTIQSHIRKIRSKLGLPSQREVTLLAAQYRKGLEDSKRVGHVGEQ